MKPHPWPPFRAGHVAARIIQHSAALCLLAGALALAGCASNEGSPSTAKPGQGITEYRQITSEAGAAIRSALKNLEKVQAQSNTCPTHVLAAFSAEVNRLQIESVQVRARAQVILDRGDAYFDQWHANMAQVKDLRLRTLAEERRPQLQESFRRIKSLSLESREAFKPFLLDLMEIRNALEKDPSSFGVDSTRELARKARQNGTQVEKCLAGVTRELDVMQAMVNPSTPVKE